MLELAINGDMWIKKGIALSRVDEENPDWLQGAWVMSSDSPYSKTAEYLLYMAIKMNFRIEYLD